MWRLALLWMIAAAVAVAIWSPVVIGLQDKGGYAAVMANHRQYVVGLSGWADSLREFVWKVEDPRTSLGLILVRWALVAWAFCAIHGIRFTWNGPGQRDWGELLLATAHPIATLVCVAVWLTCRPWRGASFFLAVALVWLTALFMTTPLYAPYPRLWLPWLIVLFLVAGPSLPWLSEADRSAFVVQRAIRGLTLFAAMMFLMYGLLSVSLTEGLKQGVWQRRADVVRAAREARDGLAQARDADEVVVYVYGEPALLFQLRLLGLPLVQPVEHLNFARPAEPRPAVPTYVLTGPHALRTARFDEQFAAAQPRLKLVKTIPWQPSRVVLMDERSGAAGTPSEFRLYRVE
jgi:hypothetical protein